MLKLATETDLHTVMDMASQFFQSTQYGDLNIDPEGMEDLVRGFVTGDSTERVCILWEEDGKVVGSLAGQLHTIPFLGRTVAVECMWWVDPAHRGGPAGTELLGAFEYWSKLRGAHFVQMMCIADKTGKVLDRFYTRRGYTQTELTYTKELA